MNGLSEQRGTVGKILSVAVPAYNAENYLEYNLSSFCIEELLPDIEIIIIDDGSTDRTGEIAEKYVRLYPGSYRVISKKNGGHGSGINCGINAAGGIYFKVVDADDWVEKAAFVNLVNALRVGTSDVVYSGFLWVYDDGLSDIRNFKSKAEIDRPFTDVLYGREYLFEAVADRLYVKMHHMTIKTEILRDNGIRLDENCYYVDAEYITYPVPHIQTIKFIEDFVYMYRIGRQGQSIGIKGMQIYEKNYDKVLQSLFKFYRDLGRVIVCSDRKKAYVAGIIARIIAGKIKIILSFPASNGRKQALKHFEQELFCKYPEIYGKNINKAVALLRKSNYQLYRPIGMLVRKKYRQGSESN